MAIIKTKVPRFNGYRASVLFKNGVGETNDPHLINWFNSHGYIVEETTNQCTSDRQELSNLDMNELKNLAKENGVFVGNTKDPDKLISKLKEVM